MQHCNITIAILFQYLALCISIITYMQPHKIKLYSYSYSKSSTLGYSYRYKLHATVQLLHFQSMLFLLSTSQH